MIEHRDNVIKILYKLDGLQHRWKNIRHHLAPKFEQQRKLLLLLFIWKGVKDKGNLGIFDKIYSNVIIYSWGQF